MISTKKWLLRGGITAAVTISCSAFAEEPSPPKLEEMVVIASRIEMPLSQIGASVSVLDGEELERKNYPMLADALRTLPGVSSAQSGGMGKANTVRIRGEEGHRTLLLIDGINVSDVSAVQAMPHFGHLMNSQLGRVEVLRGPQGMMYGADAGGVVALFSKQSEQPLEADVAAETGRYDTHRLNGNVRGAVDRVSYSLTASTLESDGFNAREDDPAEDRDGYENTTLHGTGEVAITDKTGVGVVLRSVDGNSQYDGSDAQDYREDFAQDAARVNWHYYSDTQDHEIAYERSETERRDLVWDSTFEGLIEEWQYLGSYTTDADVSFVYGLERRVDSYTSSYSEDEFERDQNAVFLENQGSVGEQFYFTLGVRYDDNEDFGQHTSYRATAAYFLPAMPGEMKLKGSYATGFRAPSLYEIGHNASMANQYDLQPLQEENSRGWEVGAEWQLDPVFLELVVFNNQIEDEIFWMNLGGWDGGYVQEAGDTLSQGVEFVTRWQVSEQLELGGNYTYNETELSENTTIAGAEPGDQRPRRPRHMLNLSAVYSPFEKLDLAVFYRNSRDAVDYVGGQGPVAIDNYDVVDFTGSWQIQPNIEAYVRWENLLDEDYQTVPGYNTAGSAGYIGARLSF